MIVFQLRMDFLVEHYQQQMDNMVMISSNDINAFEFDETRKKGKSRFRKIIGGGKSKKNARITS